MKQSEGTEPQKGERVIRPCQKVTSEKDRGGTGEGGRKEERKRTNKSPYVAQEVRASVAKKGKKIIGFVERQRRGEGKKMTQTKRFMFLGIKIGGALAQEGGDANREEKESVRYKEKKT